MTAAESLSPMNAAYTVGPGVHAALITFVDRFLERTTAIPGRLRRMEVPDL
jgi:hypothetical protein